MTEKELKRLGRRDLIEIIASMKKTEVELRDLLVKADQKLADRNIRIDNAGSIAEAAMTLSGVLEAAQAAADTYVQSVRFANSDIEERRAQAEQERERILEDARREAKRLMDDADRHCAELVAQTDAQIAERWNIFNENVQRVLESHSELSAYLKK